MDSVTADSTLFPLAGATDEESTGAYAGSKRSIKIIARQVNFFYGGQQALFDNNMEIARNRVTAIIGPSGCGKSTHIRIYNRIYELYGEHRSHRADIAGRQKYPGPLL